MNKLYFTKKEIVFQDLLTSFNCKFPQDSRTLLSILADLFNPVNYMVLILSLPFFQALGDRFKCTNYNWHHRHLHVPQLLRLSGKIQVFVYLFIFKGFRTIVFIFIVISTTFRPICPPAFFRCLSNSGTFRKLQTTSFIESTGVVCSDSISHNWVQVLCIPVLLLACNEDWTSNLQKLREPTLRHASCWTIQSEFWGFINLMFLLD